MNKGKSAESSVTLRTKGNKTEPEAGNLRLNPVSVQPGMKALQSMIEAGQVSRQRVVRFLKGGEA